MDLISLVITIVFVAIIFWLVWWWLGDLALPEPFNKVIRALVGLAAIIYLIGVLTGQAPAIPIRFK